MEITDAVTRWQNEGFKQLDKELETTYNIPDLLTFINVSA